MATPRRVEPEGLAAMVEALERHGVEHIVIGGVAARARGWSKDTDDFDITPAQDHDNLDRLAAALTELDAGFRVDEERYPDGFKPPGGLEARTFRNQPAITFQTRYGPLDVVSLPDGTGGYDQLIEHASRERLPDSSITLLVASASDVIRSKEEAARPKDFVELPQLRRELEVPTREHEGPDDGLELGL